MSHRYMKPLSLFQALLKSNVLERGRLLGLDVSDKYVGLAVSDFQNQIASPFRRLQFLSNASSNETAVLLRKKTNIDLMATNFQTLISELSLSGFIFGYPFTRQQRSSPDNVELLLKDLNLHPVQSKTIIDIFAAVGILQDYLDFANKTMKIKSKD